jgi:hypothetical protein
MKYSFFIDQQAISNAGLIGKTDTSDWIIMEYIRAWEGTKLGVRQGGKIWINYQHLINEVPILGITSTSTISKRIKKLKTLGLLSVFNDKLENKLFVETTAFYSQVLYSKDHNITVELNQDPVELNQDPVELNQDPVELNQDPVELNQDPVELNQPIHQSVYNNQNKSIRDTCNADALARFKKSEPEKQRQESKTSLVELVRPWYQAQGYSEDIEEHFGYFMNRLATYTRIPMDLQGHFVRAITEDWANLRKTKQESPEWAMVPDGTEPGDEGNNLCRFIEKHGYPNKLRWLYVSECRAELRKLAAQRLIEYRLSSAA